MCMSLYVFPPPPLLSLSFPVRACSTDEVVAPKQPADLHGLDIKREQCDLNRHSSQRLPLQQNHSHSSQTGTTMAHAAAERATSGIVRGGVGAGDPVADFLRGLSYRSPATDLIPRRMDCVGGVAPDGHMLSQTSGCASDRISTQYDGSLGRGGVFGHHSASTIYSR